ncbi:MAG: hypothetical protein NC041_06090 [Bacteroides sp.]|nr:hypothetical protein [Prevotella sp.]MCM1407526.1 hypothetical protein [Treponema brennaborense]MCM1470016.1 hypothetical protein [Bacteroides sp.]
MCWKCGKPIEAPLVVSRSAVCGHCGSDIRSCRNCAHYEEGAHYDCRETVEECVFDKERANFCGYFKVRIFSEKADSRARAEENKSADARRLFDSLFGN